MIKKSHRFFEQYPKTTLVLLVGTLAVLLDGIAGALFIPGNDHDFRVYDPYFHHGLLPNQAQVTHWGPIAYPIATNSLGFRDAIAREVPLTSDKHRILFMGDSHTEGVGVSFAESFTGRLIAQVDTTQLEILNAAAVSYSPKLYYYKTKYLIEEVGLAFDQLYVFIDVSDVQNEYAYEQFHPGTSAFGAVASWLDKKLKTFSLLYFATTQLYLEQKKKKFYQQVSQQQLAHNNTVDIYHTFFSDFDDDVLLNNPQFHATLTEWYSDESLYRRWGKKGTEWMTVYMQKLADLCHQRSIRMTVVVHPWRTHVMKGEVDDRHTHHWRSFTQENDLPFISLYPVFINELPPEEVIASAYIPDDNHWTAVGHRWVADKLFSFVGTRPRSTLAEDRYYYHQGIVQQEKELPDSAIFYFSQAIGLNPTQADYYYRRGWVYLKEKHFDLAAEDFEQVLVLDATHRKARFSLQHLPAYRSVDRYTRLLEAQETADGYVQRGKAWLQLERHQRAYDDFERARELDPGIKEPYYYIGYIKHHRMKASRESIPYFNRAIALDSGYREAYQQRTAAFQNIGADDQAAKDRDRVQQLGVKSSE